MTKAGSALLDHMVLLSQKNMGGHLFVHSALLDAWTFKYGFYVVLFSFSVPDFAMGYIGRRNLPEYAFSTIIILVDMAGVAF